ncbi:hypothetical protein FRC18_007250, partial [Serendipita sp. 400]
MQQANQGKYSVHALHYDADAIQNPNNPMPNGNGAPLGAVDGTATDDSPLLPPLPPPRSEPES